MSQLLTSSMRGSRAKVGAPANRGTAIASTGPRGGSAGMRAQKACQAPIHNHLMKSKTISATEASRLYELDRTYWLHPLGDLGAAAGTVPQLMLRRGEGGTRPGSR